MASCVGAFGTTLSCSTTSRSSARRRMACSAWSRRPARTGRRPDGPRHAPARRHRRDRPIKEAHPGIQVVALTSFIEEEKVTAALEAGASGFILKDAEADDVAAAIRAAYNDEVHLDPRPRGSSPRGCARARPSLRPSRSRSAKSRCWPWSGGAGATRRSRPISGSPSARRGPTSTHPRQAQSGEPDAGGLYAVERRLVPGHD